MKAALDISDIVRFSDGTVIRWADFSIDEPDFSLPEGVERIEYTPGVRLSFHAGGNQYGDSAFNGAWADGDIFIARKDEYVANAVARQPPPPPSHPPPENTKVGEAKIAIDAYLIDPLADAKMKVVLAKIREIL